uniref:Peptidase A1 domain-containing protein n=1 Tax=Anas platyrhynchos TaxID=8839 RepID=A0A8B9TMC0_ANAPL
YGGEFAIGGSPTGWCSRGCQAIVDTGTFLLTVPQQYLNRFLQAVGAQETSYGYAVECSQIHSLPTITFVINGTALPRSPPPCLLLWASKTSPGTCVGSEQPPVPLDMA